MKSCVFFVCVLMLCANLVAQPKQAAKLVTSMPEKQDTAYVNALNKQAVATYLCSPDSARAMAEKALILSTQLKYARGKGYSFAAIGYTYWAQSYYSISIYYLFNAVEYLKAAKEYGELSFCDRIMSRNYVELSEFDLAKAYLKAADTNIILSKDPSKIGLTYIESSFIDLWLNNYDQAWAKSKLALALSFKIKDSELTAVMYSRQANILNETGHRELAKKYFDTSFVWSELSKNNRLKSYLFKNFAEYYADKGKIDSTLLMANAAVRLADTLGNMDLKLKSELIIAEAYKANKDTTQELEYRRSYSKLQDSVRLVYRANNFLFLQRFFELNTKLHQLEEQEQNNIINKNRLRFQNAIILLLVIFIAILIAGLLTIYYLYNEKKRLANQLAERNDAVIEQKDIIQEQSKHLSELNNLKTKLFAVISHDLRTPISSLRSIMGLFQQNNLSEEETVSLLKRMLPALDGADLTLSNLLNWSMKQMNGLRVNKSSLPLLQMAEEISKVFESAAQQKNIQLDISIADASRVDFDEHHLKIILRNLVSNAIKFTPQNGRITIGEQNKQGKTIIYVKDTGNGINETDLPKLFTSTVYFTTRGTGGEKGTGLGLLLCKELAELNNCSIYVESTQGQGATFYINTM